MIKEAKKIQEATGFKLVLGMFHPRILRGKGILIDNPNEHCFRVNRALSHMKLVNYLVLEGFLTSPYYLRQLKDLTIYVPSREVKSHFEMVGVDVEGIIPHGIRDVMLLHRKKRRKPRLLYIAWWHSFLPRKFPKWMIGSLERVKYPFELYVLTSPDNPYHWYLSKFGEVRLEVGKLSEKEISELYKTADFYLSFSSAEGFGVPILEALAHSMPVIHVNANPFNEITTEKCSFRFNYRKVTFHNAGYFNAVLYEYTPQSLANAVNRALEIYHNDFETYLGYCQEAYNRACDFLYENTYVKWIDVLERL